MFVGYVWPYRPWEVFYIVCVSCAVLQTIFVKRRAKIRFLLPFLGVLDLLCAVFYACHADAIPGVLFSEIYLFLTYALPGVAALAGAALGTGIGALWRAPE